MSRLASFVSLLIAFLFLSGFGGCGFLDMGNNFHEQPAGGKLEQPTDLQRFTAVSKDGRYALTFQAKTESSCTLIGSNYIIQAKAKATLFVLDLHTKTVRDIDLARNLDSTSSTQSSCLSSYRAEILFYPDNQSFLLLTSFYSDFRLQHIRFSTLEILWQARLKQTDEPKSSQAWSPWPLDLPDSHTYAFPIPASYFILSPSGRYLALRDIGTTVVLLDIQERRFFTFRWRGLTTDLSFDPKERSLYGYSMSSDLTFTSKGPNKPKHRFSVHRFDLASASSLAFSMENGTHGLFGATPSLTVAPDGELLLVNACEIVSQEQGCSAVIFFLDPSTMQATAKLPGAGPLGITPDGSTIVGWDGVRNEHGQIWVSFEATATEQDRGLIQHKLLLIDRQTRESKSVPLDLANPTYFLTAKGNLAVTTSVYGGDRMILTDLDSGRSITIWGHTPMKNFSSSTDGSVIYILEDQSLHVLDLRRGTFFRYPTPLQSPLDGLIVMPDAFLPSPISGPTPQPSSAPPAPEKPALRSSLTNLQTPFLRDLRSQLTRPFQAVTLPWRSGQLDRQDLLLLVSNSRTRFSLWQVDQTSLHSDLHLHGF